MTELTTQILPATSVSEESTFFSEPALRLAKKLLILSRLSISFIKETPKFIIVSGIIKDNRSHEAKIVYRMHSDHPDGVLSSNCDCELWSKSTHCPHAAALFIYFFHSHKKNNQNPNVIQRPEAMDVYHGLEQGPLSTMSDSMYGLLGAVTPAEFGTIINGPSKLQGSAPSATYSSLQYILTNKKNVTFPVPKTWDRENLLGKIQINFQFNKTDGFGTGGESIAIPELFFTFIHKNQDNVDVIEKEISIFENLYLFNWKNGDAYHLPSEAKEIIQKIRILNFNLGINQLLWFSSIPGFDLFFDIIVQGVKSSDLTGPKLAPVISINSVEKGTLDFNLEFIDENKKLYTPPELFRALTFDNGSLELFKKKKDAYSFILQLFEILKDEEFASMKQNFLSRFRADWPIFVQYLKTPGPYLEYDDFNKTFYQIEKDTIFNLFLTFVESFGDTIFRFSNYNKDEIKIVYKIQSGIAFQGLRTFVEKVQFLGCSIYFDRKEIGRWNSRIRFERRASTTRWFDLDVNLSAEDFNILKQIDHSTGMAMSDLGLIMLTEDQLTMAKMLQKFSDKTAKNDQIKSSGDSEYEYKFTIPYNRSRVIEIFELKKMGIEGILTKEEEDLCHNLLNLKEMPQYEIPEEFQNVLRPYQKVGLNWMRFLYEHKLGACLADDMGLGKTLQVIALLKAVEKRITSVLVVCPVTILINWQKEFEKFSDIQTFIYHGGQRQLPQDCKFIITSYGVMKKEADTTFKDIKFDVLILDEVQHLKNMRSLGAWAARKIQADFRICLTGTPVENDLAEFYNILDLAVPGVWGDLQITRIVSTDISRERARKTAGPFILRRTKSQVLTDLPPKIENDILLPFSDEERQSYLKGLLEIKSRIEGTTSKKKYGEILRGLLRLRQSCLWQSPNLSAGQVPKHLNDVQSTKIKFLLDQLEQIIEGGHKAIVFSQFTTYLDIIQHFLREKHYRLSRIDGAQQLKARQQQVDSFQEGNAQVFLISLKAGGVGLNLTAASYVFLMDPWWNPAVEAQAIDRAHRIGQKNTLTVYRPIIKDSVEEKVLKLQEVKKQLFMDLLPDDDEKIFSGRLTMEDFVQLFN